MISLFRSNPSHRDVKTRAAYAMLVSSLGLPFVTTPAQAESPSVVTTIKPLHSIASAVMKGVGTPHILIDGAASPHGFALKPSQAFLLEGADAVFWVGPELAPSLEKPISSMANDAVAVALLEDDSIQQLSIREGANFDAHGHEEDDDHDEHNDHDDHDEHSEAHDDEAHEEHEHSSQDAEHEHEHEGSKDAHIWLNPDNGISIAGIMAETLSELDPANADTYRTNAAQYAERIEKLENTIAASLEPLRGKKFVVFHDAYHHFEHHFEFEASGAITLSPEALASADRVAEVQSQIKSLNVTCVFQEPQFDSKLVNVVLEGSDARKGSLDPLGTELVNGPDLYPDLLQGLADTLVDCLSGQS